MVYIDGGHYPVWNVLMFQAWKEHMKPRILFFITVDWFWSHRLPIARAVRDADFEVLIATRVDQHKKRIEKEGFRLIAIGLERRSKNS